MGKRLGIYGGSFDPIHVGHLVMAEMAREQCRLDKIIFIPAGSPPHKTNRKLAPPRERYDMVRLAIEDNPYFEASSMEIEREGKSFTIDTLKELRKTYSADWEFWLIIGMDSLLEIRTWHHANQIVEMCKLAVYPRRGYSIEQCDREAELLKYEMGTDITFVSGPLIEISSTQIRELIEAGRSIRYLVPKSVQVYIQEHFLYGSQFGGKN